MALMQVALPKEIERQLKQIDGDLDNIMGSMTRAGAEVVEHNIRANAPDAIKKSNMMQNLSLTRNYKTASDGSMNTKVMFSGDFVDKDGRTKHAPLVANVFEYGRSNAPFPQDPFLRKSFGSKTKIEKAK